MHAGPFELHSSAQLSGLIALLFFLATLCCCQVISDLSLRIAVVLTMSMVAYRIVQRYARLKNKQSVVCLRQEAGDDWCLSTSTETDLQVRLKSYMLIGTELIFLYFEGYRAKEKYKIPIAADSLAQASHRRLRVLLAHGRYVKGQARQ